MKKDIREYFKVLGQLLGKAIVTGSNNERYEFDEAIEVSISLIIERAAQGRKLFLIGNGASASIASHMATDFWKNADIKAFSFNDSSLLTCISNDFGYRHVFEKPIEMFSEPQDILIAISSSGQSENILCAAAAAKERGLKVITLSGFNQDNPLRRLGDINFYVPISEYGFVETMHHSICHCLVDIIIKKKAKLVERAGCHE